MEALYRTIQAPDRGNVFLILRGDGTVVGRYPARPEAGAKMDEASPLPPDDRPAGTFVARPSPDQDERLCAFRRIRDLDVVVVAGMTTSMVYRDWRERTIRNVLLFTGSMLLLAALGAMANAGLREQRRLLHSVEQKAQELANTLADKDVLFQEVHHRVKNNLQVISSLLTMQSLHVQDEPARQTLRDALDRIASMGLVHQILYEHNTASKVDLGTYFGRLAEALISGHGLGPGGVAVRLDVDGVMDLERAVPLGLLGNEAISNALKHAFPNSRPGTVSVSLVRTAEGWHFSVRDDGVGMPDQPGRGIGLSLIRALSRQLNGQSAISRDGGTTVVVTFPA